ncbi:MAG TPA: DUF3300 domain-containing protein [Burkholderiales bacterium]|nr:DUF3300 domain-containing protein [Burkholderiales bacterium]
MRRNAKNLPAWCLAALAAFALPMHAQQPAPPLQVSPDLVSPQQQKAAASQQAAAAFSKEQIEQLVAPIALYPDALVAQVLMASTYPLEVVQAARWSKANPKVTGKALEDAMLKQPWDASVKSLTATPQVLEMMNDKLDWMQKLGDAFLAQQKEVLDGVQRLRAKALAEGNLKSGKEQKITTDQEAGTTVIKIEPTNPEVVYVPVYNPTVVYGVWPYPAYPPYYYYPPYYAGGVFFAFSVGIVIGSAWWGGCHWGGGNVYINHNTYNNFNRTNISSGDWQHKPEHRKGVEYRDQGSRDKYGGQRPSADTRDAYRGRDGAGPSTADRQRDAAGARDRSAAGPSTADRAGGGQPGAADRQRDAAGGRTPSPAPSDRAGSRQPGAFEGAGQGQGAQTRDYSSRGASSRSSAASQSRPAAAPRAAPSRPAGGGGGGRRR